MKRLKTMNMSLELTKSAKEFLAEKGYDPAFGARPLKRAVQKYLEEPLSEEILKGRFTSGSVIKVKLSKNRDELVFYEAGKQKDEPEELTEEEK